MRKSKSRNGRISKFLLNDNLWAILAMACLAACYKSRIASVSIVSLGALYLMSCEAKRLIAIRKMSGLSSPINFESVFLLFYLIIIALFIIPMCASFCLMKNTLTIRCMAAIGILHILHEAHKLIYYSEERNWGYRVVPHLISATIIGSFFVIYVSGGKGYLSYAYIAGSGILAASSLILEDVVQDIRKGESGTLPTILAVIFIAVAILGTLRPEFYGLVEINIQAAAEEFSKIIFDLAQYATGKGYKSSSTMLLGNAREASAINDPSILFQTCFNAVGNLQKLSSKASKNDKYYESLINEAINKIYAITNCINPLVA